MRTIHVSSRIEQGTQAHPNQAQTPARHTMSEQERQDPLITITETDIQEANQLSLHCPICAGPVENHVADPALTPVVCTKCGTLYHHACWGQNGGKCAVLGCDHKEARRYGVDLGPVLKISPTDVPTDAQVDRMERRRLKSAEKATPRGRVARKPDPEPGFWRRLYQRILRAFGN